jgi:hypothetical protein
MVTIVPQHSRHNDQQVRLVPILNLLTVRAVQFVVVAIAPLSKFDVAVTSTGNRYAIIVLIIVVVLVAFGVTTLGLRCPLSLLKGGWS